MLSKESKVFCLQKIIAETEKWFTKNKDFANLKRILVTRVSGII